jgi:hypothetical protein
MSGELWVPTCLATGKATSKEPKARAPANPPGSETTARHQGKVGSSGDPMQSSQQGVGRYNRQTGRTPDKASEVGCPHTSEEVG